VFSVPSIHADPRQNSCSLLRWHITTLNLRVSESEFLSKHPCQPNIFCHFLMHPCLWADIPLQLSCAGTSSRLSMQRRLISASASSYPQQAISTTRMHTQASACAHTHTHTHAHTHARAQHTLSLKQAFPGSYGMHSPCLADTERYARFKRFPFDSASPCHVQACDSWVATEHRCKNGSTQTCKLLINDGSSKRVERKHVILLLVD
jgi:hypothetical protein